MNGGATITIFEVHNEIIHTNSKKIIDADSKNGDILAIVKDTNHLSVEFNGLHLIDIETHHYLIRFTKSHFCVLQSSKLSFYTMQGEKISTVHIGKNISQLFPYQDGVICSYRDEGVFGDDIGQHILHFAQPNKPLQSLEDFALQHDFLFDPLFTRFKPLAAISHNDDSILLFDEKLTLQNKLEPLIPLGNVLAFSLSYNTAIFLEEHQFIIWPYLEGHEYYVIPNTFTQLPQTINFRDDGCFIEINEHEVIRYKIEKQWNE